MVDASLISFAVIVPFVLIVFNLLVLARYIDPQAAAGHYFAKLMVVSAGARYVWWGAQALVRMVRPRRRGLPKHCAWRRRDGQPG